MKMTPQKERSKKIKVLDKLFSLYIRSRSNWRCERCNKDFSENKGQLHCAHIISKGVSPLLLRFEERNAIALCYFDHIHWWHHQSTETKEWFIGKFGKERMNWLEKNARVSGRGLNLDYVWLELENKIKELTF